jgi:GDP-4-dehydro-6-deoxy-D-mannose reductase
VRAYVTGASGFVGGWLRAHLAEVQDEVVSGGAEADVTQSAVIASSIAAAAPDVVYHLAALAHVGRSWQEPLKTFEVNAIGTLNVLEGAARCDSPPLVVLVSSAEVYGRSVGESPIAEGAPLLPATPYAASKVAAEYLGLQAWLGRDLPVIRVRPFNHFGPRQSPDFVVSALARRVAEAERSGGGKVAVGNLAASRDFTDVRDVVRAYRLLATSGSPGEAYNVASGRSVAIAEVAEKLCAMATETVELVADPELYRPVDVPVFVGDATFLRTTTGWEPRIPFRETLEAVLDYWRKELTGG